MSHIRVTTNSDGSRYSRDTAAYQHHGGRKNRNYRGQRNLHGVQHSGRPPRLSRLDEDVQMSDGSAAASSSSDRQRYNPYGARYRRDRPGGTRIPMARAVESGIMQRLGLPVVNEIGLKNNGPEWYKIIIPYGARMTKDFILKSITSGSACPFVPVNFHIEDGAAVFYVIGGREASAIRNTSKRFTAPNGFKMIVQTKRSGPPPASLTDEVVKKLKECMSKRCDISTMSLSLSDLSNDADLKREDIYISLSRQNVVNKVLQIIEENIPELRMLDLSHNGLQTLDFFSKIADKAPKIQQLSLTKNQLRSDRELQYLVKLNLEELCLDGNPLCDRFTDRQTYVSAIRKHFPKVVKLDGHVLPPPITFDIEVPTTLPPTKGSFFVTEQVQAIVGRFIEQYFALYDSVNRQMLLEAYHEQASFSLTVHHNNSWSGGKQPSFSDYLTKCRNFTRTRDNAQRYSRLKRGRSNIISVLSELPLTQHDPQSFVVDVGFASATMLTFTVHGIFKEISNKTDKDVVRQFSRTFMAIPNGLGVAITNEMFSITNALLETAQKYFKSPIPSTTISVAPTATPVSTDASALTDIQQQMIKSFSLQSGMNENFSAMCLAQNNWNYDAAAKVFTDMKEKNSIPPEAFTR